MDNSVDGMWISLARVGHATPGHDIALATSTDLPQPLAQLWSGQGPDRVTPEWRLQQSTIL